MIRADNDRLKKELRELRNAKKETESAARKTAPVEKKVPKKDSRKLPGNNTYSLIYVHILFIEGGVSCVCTCMSQ